LEAHELKKWEKAQKKEAAIKEAEEAKKGAAAGKKAPAAKAKGKEAEKPQFDIPKMEVPVITEFTSESGNKYVRERPIEEIAENLMKPQEEEKESTTEEEEDKAGEQLE